jgi:hypothetical protein
MHRQTIHTNVLLFPTKSQKVRDLIVLKNEKFLRDAFIALHPQQGFEKSVILLCGESVLFISILELVLHEQML